MARAQRFVVFESEQKVQSEKENNDITNDNK